MMLRVNCFLAELPHQQTKQGLVLASTSGAA